MTAELTTRSLKSSALIKQIPATGNGCPTRRLVRHQSQIRERNSTLVPLHYDLSRFAGLGELDGFFELLKWKVMGDDR